MQVCASKFQMSKNSMTSVNLKTNSRSNLSNVMKHLVVYLVYRYQVCTFCVFSFMDIFFYPVCNEKMMIYETQEFDRSDLILSMSCGIYLVWSHFVFSICATPSNRQSMERWMDRCQIIKTKLAILKFIAIPDHHTLYQNYGNEALGYMRHCS